MSEAAPRAVVAGHAGFAAGMVSAVDRIAGRGEALRPVSNDGLDAAAVEAAVRDALRAHGAHVVFTDLPAGSCTIAARRIAREDPSVAVVTGVSVATLLDFVMGPGDTEDDLRRAAARGGEAVRVFPAGGARAG